MPHPDVQGQPLSPPCAFVVHAATSTYGAKKPAAASTEIYRAALFETRFQLKLSIGLIGVLILSKGWKRFQANPAVYWSLESRRR